MIGSARWSDALRRYFGLAGELIVGRELSPDLVPIVTLEPHRPEWEYLIGTRLVAGSIIGAPPDLNERRTVQLANPAGSGVLLVVDHVILSAVESAT